MEKEYKQLYLDKCVENVKLYHDNAKMLKLLGELKSIEDELKNFREIEYELRNAMDELQTRIMLDIKTISELKNDKKHLTFILSNISKYLRDV